MNLETEEFRFSYESEPGLASWDMLKSHHEKGLVLLVDSSLPLKEVTSCIVNDKKNMISFWVENKLITRPSGELVEKWEKEPLKNRVNFYIAQPYVVTQELT